MKLHFMTRLAIFVYFLGSGTAGIFIIHGQASWIPFTIYCAGDIWFGFLAGIALAMLLVVFIYIILWIISGSFMPEEWDI